MLLAWLELRDWQAACERAVPLRKRSGAAGGEPPGQRARAGAAGEEEGEAGELAGV